MSTGKVLFGVLAGIAAGAALGVLLAPDSGASTRKKIAQKGEDYVDGLGEQFNGFVEGMSKKFESLKGDVTRLKEHGKATMDGVLADASKMSR